MLLRTWEALIYLIEGKNNNNNNNNNNNTNNNDNDNNNDDDGDDDNNNYNNNTLKGLSHAILSCFIFLIMSSKRQIGRPRVIHLQNHGHITTENDFQLSK